MKTFIMLFDVVLKKHAMFRPQIYINIKTITHTYPSTPSFAHKGTHI